MSTTKDTAREEKPLSLSVVLNMLRTVGTEVSKLYADTYQPMIIRQRYYTVYRSLMENVAVLEKVTKIQEARKQPCYVRENGTVRKMTLDELIQSLDETAFDEL